MVLHVVLIQAIYHGYNDIYMTCSPVNYQSTFDAGIKPVESLSL